MCFRATIGRYCWSFASLVQPRRCCSSGFSNGEEHLREVILQRVPSTHCITLQTVYGSLTTDERKGMRRSGFPTLLSFLKRLQEKVVTGQSSSAAPPSCRILVSDDGLRVVKWDPVSSDREAAVKLLNPVPVAPKPALSRTAAPWNNSDSLTENLWEIYELPIPDNFSPPPPVQLSAQYTMDKADRKVHQKVGVGYAGVFTADMLVPYVPTFFVPLSSLSKSLPDGYTQAHVEELFSISRALEIVRLEGETFVRLHGGSSGDLGRSSEANEKFREFEPDPTLCQELSTHFERPYKWYSLRDIVSRLDSHLLARLPFQNYQSLLYFAQMQHRFQFAADGEGSVCTVDAAENLDYRNTPTPIAHAETVKILEQNGLMSIAEVLDSLSRSSLASLVSTFNSPDEFFASHSTFEYCSVNRTVELKAQTEHRRRQTRSLEERLDDALQSGEKRDVRKIRRRIAVMRNPDNPLLDRARLTEEVKKFLPVKRHIRTATLLKNLPPDLIDLMPASPISFFRSQPDHFQVFEFREPGKLCVMRSGIPLPDGHLRQSFTADEIVYLCAVHLADHPRVMCDVYSRLPWGARETVRLKHKSLFFLLALYPQYFAIVFKDGKQKFDSRAAMVTLVGHPPPLSRSLVIGSRGTITDSDALMEEAAESEAAANMKRVTADLGYTAKKSQEERPIADAGDDEDDDPESEDGGT